MYRMEIVFCAAVGFIYSFLLASFICLVFVLLATRNDTINTLQITW